METKANFVRVGIVTLTILVLAFGFVYWAVFATSGSSRVPLIVRIDGSVTGLQQGSQVQFNGLPVGVVTGLRIDPNDPGVVIATTQVNPDTPITPATQANLGFAGLTGSAFIQLSGGDGSQESIIQEANAQGTVPVIRANPSDVTDILATARDISERANNILGQFESIVNAVGPSVETTARNVANISQSVETVTADLANNSDQIDEFLVSLGSLADTATDVARDLPSIVTRADQLVAAIEPSDVNAFVSNVTAISSNLREQSGRLGEAVDSVRTAANSIGVVGETITRNQDGIDAFFANLGPVSESAGRVAERLDTTLESANRVIAAVDPAKISSTLTGIQTAATNIGAVAAGIGEQQEAIERTIASAAATANNLQVVTQSVAERREQLGQLLGNLGPISDNIASVTGEAQGVVADARRIVAAVDPAQIANSVDRLSAVAQNLSTVSAVVASNEESIDSALTNAAAITQNLRAVTAAVAERREAIDRFFDNVEPITADIRQAAGRLNGAAASAQELVAAVDVQAVNQTVDDVRDITATVSARRGEIGSIIERVNTTVATLNTTLNGLSQTREQVDSILAAVEPERINRAVTNVSNATDNVAEAADSIRGVANSVGQRREDIDEIITNVQTTSERLSTASARIDSVVTSVNDVLAGGNDGTRLGEDLAGALRSIRAAAVAIQTQIAPLSASLQGTATTAGRDFSDLIDNLNRSVNQIQRSVSDFADDPSQIIFGGSGAGGNVKTYDGRTRR